MISTVQDHHGVPTLFVDGEPVPGFAYITYRTYNNQYKDFANLGCRLFSVPVFFGEQTINETSRIPPMAPGIFDSDQPNFALFDTDIQRILDARPDAWIFPRVNLSLPYAWEEAHPDECCDFAYAEHHRASFASDAWAEETIRLLGLFLDHIDSAPYKEHIVGIQLAGGNTEEWFPFDMRGSVGLRFREKFAQYCQDHGIAETDEEERRKFMSLVTANRILEFAAFTKEKTKHRLVVGCFYGYTLECTDPNTGHHALRLLLNSPDVDFICSPVSYANLRPVGMDHACMLPVDSMKLHGKLYFAENDTRTHLSKAPNDLPAYNTSIWFGPDVDTTCEIMKMHFARALLHGHAMWWFDMWGRWYDDARYLALLQDCYRFCERALDEDRQSLAEVAVFVDERAYAKEVCDRRLCYDIRKTLGQIGTPYDIYLMDDYPAVKEKYKAHIFLCPAETDAFVRAVADAKNPFVIRSLAVTTAEIRAYLAAQNVHIWCENAVVYGCGAFLFVHQIGDSSKVCAKNGVKLVPLFSKDSMSQLYRIER